MVRASKIAHSTSDREDAGGGNNSSIELQWLTQDQSNCPLFPSVSDPRISYTLPQWLVPERYKDKQSSQNTKRTRVFSIPLPDVPANTRQAIRTHLVKHYTQQNSGMKDSEQKLKEIKLEEKQAAFKAKAAKDKLAQALFTKSEKLKEIRRVHEAETTKAIEELEAKMRDQQRKEDLILEERIKTECKLEYDNKFEEEMILKRKRDQEEDGKEAMEATSVANKARQEKELTAEGAPKRSSDSKVAEGKSVHQHVEEFRKGEALEKKHDELQRKMEKLSEEKREFYWLLKQVIKQESLQKIKKG